jgi:hypothetical protein
MAEAREQAPQAPGLAARILAMAVDQAALQPAHGVVAELAVILAVAVLVERQGQGQQVVTVQMAAAAVADRFRLPMALVVAAA